MSASGYLDISIAKKKARDALIPEEWRITVPSDEDNLLDLARSCGIFSADELRITEDFDSIALLHEIHSGQLSSVEVTDAFCKV